MIRKVHLLQNERTWIGGSFSSKRLLPIERNTYSTMCGSVSWKTLEEAGNNILERGYEWCDDEFTLLENCEETDEEGWQYAKDFSLTSLENKMSKMTTGKHWVRFRRLVRTKRFNPEIFLDKEVYILSEHFDSTAVNDISCLMLEVLTYVVLIHKKGKDNPFTFLQIMPNKRCLINQLNIGESKGKESTHMSPVDISFLRSTLKCFAEGERLDIRNTFSKTAKVSFEQRHDEKLLPGFSDRCKEISSVFFPKSEINALSSLWIQCLDPTYQYHCNPELCGTSCEFSLTLCPNKNCDVEVSLKFLSTHIKSCPYKLISCPLGCGDTIERKKENIHVLEVCSLREVPCPFQNIGCSVTVIAKDLVAHIEKDSHSHLLLGKMHILMVDRTNKNLFIFDCEA